jgi:hypothetical protein
MISWVLQLFQLEFDQTAVIDAILASVDPTLTSRSGADEESENFLEHSIAQRSIKRMATDNKGIW